MVSDRTFALLACPYDQRPLIATGASLACGEGHRYEIIEGIPILLRDDIAHTHWAADLSLQAARGRAALDNWADPEPMDRVHRYVQEAIGGTGGNMYRSLIGRLPRYPIPDFPLDPGRGRTLIDIGSNWGRWTVAAARRGYHAVGVDVGMRDVVADDEMARTRREREAGMSLCPSKLPLREAL